MAQVCDQHHELTDKLDSISRSVVGLEFNYTVMGKTLEKFHADIRDTRDFLKGDYEHKGAAIRIRDNEDSIKKMDCTLAQCKELYTCIKASHGTIQTKLDAIEKATGAVKKGASKLFYDVIKWSTISILGFASLKVIIYVDAIKEFIKNANL